MFKYAVAGVLLDSEKEGGESERSCKNFLYKEEDDYLSVVLGCERRYFFRISLLMSFIDSKFSPTLNPLCPSVISNQMTLA